MWRTALDLAMPFPFALQIIHGSMPVNFRRSDGTASPFLMPVRSLGDQLVDHDITRLAGLHVCLRY